MADMELHTRRMVLTESWSPKIDLSVLTDLAAQLLMQDEDSS